MNYKIIYSEINKSNSSIVIFYMYSTGKYLEISKYTNLRLRSAALRAMDDDDGVGDGGARYGTSGRGPVCVVEFQVKYLPVPVLVKYYFSKYNF